ncbi:MAG: class I fructose-bisphosphate aldolase [Anaerolineaceae bacterium]
MKSRYYRLFREDGKALILAFDHGGSGDIWVDPAVVIRAVAAGGMDGILTNYGVLTHFRKEIGRMGTILRMEVIASGLVKYNPILERPMGNSPYSIEDCLRLGVDGVMTMGIIGNEFDTANLKYIAGVVAACQQYGLIAAAEMLPNGFSSKEEDRNLKAMNIACRVGAELGLDIVKTEFTKPVEDFKKIVANCYADVLALGGAKVNDDRQVLENAKQAMEAGCKGLVIGRNVWGHRNITGMAAALRRIVHENASVEDALKEIK